MKKRMASCLPCFMLMITSFNTAYAMDADEINELIAGKTILLYHIKKDMSLRHFYASDGTLLEEHPEAGVRKGIWKVDGDKLCVAFRDSAARCRPFLEKDGEYGTANRKGTRIRIVYREFTQGNQIKLPETSAKSAQAASITEQLVTLKTRENVSQTFLLVEPSAKPKGVVILYPGHEGVIRFKKLGDKYIIENEGGGITAHEKSRQVLSEAGYAVAVLAPPSDQTAGMDTDFRFSAEHARDAEKVISYLNNRYKQDVYLHGHCRSSFSPPAVATRLNNRGIRGLILSSTRSEGKHGSVMDLQKGAIRVPVLLVHHVKDPCDGTPYSRIYQVRSFYETAAPKVDLISVNGGEGKRPDDAPGCSGGYHGFRGIRKPVMNAIVNWLENRDFPAMVTD